MRSGLDDDIIMKHRLNDVVDVMLFPEKQGSGDDICLGVDLYGYVLRNMVMGVRVWIWFPFLTRHNRESCILHPRGVDKRSALPQPVPGRSLDCPLFKKDDGGFFIVTRDRH